MSVRHQHRIGAYVLLGMSFLVLGCDSSSPVSLPNFGTLSVSVMTTGANLDPDGYQLVVTGPSLNVARAMAVNDSATFSIVTGGDYTLDLGGLSANCTADVNPQTVTAFAGGLAELEFDISCV